MTLVSVALGAGVSSSRVWLAALGVRERAPAAGAALRRGCGCGGSCCASWSFYAASSLAFALFESYLHWRTGLGFHGLSCLIGPVHRNALPILAALALVAAALAEAAAHVLAWMRAVVARAPRRPLARLAPAVRRSVPRGAGLPRRPFSARGRARRRSPRSRLFTYAKGDE